MTAAATPEPHTLSLHDALPICRRVIPCLDVRDGRVVKGVRFRDHVDMRSEEHTSELQSRRELVCRLLLEKKKTPPRCAWSPSPVNGRCVEMAGEGVGFAGDVVV